MPILPYQLPIDHPHYSYPMSKNPYAKKLKEKPKYVFINQETEKHQKNWKSQFLSSPFLESKIYLEIGCNAGHVLIPLAQKNPHHLFIGLDWKYKAIFKAYEKAEKWKLKNIIFLRAHASRLPYIFGPSELTSILLFFPDPWPKKSSWKKRWITQESLYQLAQLVTINGTLTIKTDHPGYFEWILQSAKAQQHWEILEISYDLHSNHPNPQTLSIPEVTVFEKLFIQKKIPIRKLHMKRI